MLVGPGVRQGLQVKDGRTSPRMSRKRLDSLPISRLGAWGTSCDALVTDLNPFASQAGHGKVPAPRPCHTHEAESR